MCKHVRRPDVLLCRVSRVVHNQEMSMGAIEHARIWVVRQAEDESGAPDIENRAWHLKKMDLEDLEDPRYRPPLSTRPQHTVRCRILRHRQRCGNALSPPSPSQHRQRSGTLRRVHQCTPDTAGHYTCAVDTQSAGPLEAPGRAPPQLHPEHQQRIGEPHCRLAARVPRTPFGCRHERSA